MRRGLAVAVALATALPSPVGAADRTMFGEYSRIDAKREPTSAQCVAHFAALPEDEREGRKLKIGPDRFEAGEEGAFLGNVTLGTTVSGATRYTIAAETVDDIVQMKGVITELVRPYRLIRITLPRRGENGRDQVDYFCRVSR